MARFRFESVGLAPGAFGARTAAFEKRRESAARCEGLAVAALAEFRAGGHLFGLTKGQFSMIDIAAAMLARTGAADVTVWTWCIADYEIEAIGAFVVSEAIRSFRLVVDWAGAQRDMPVLADLQARFGDDCIRVTKNHAKVAMIANAEWSVVIRGSMNLNANPRFEQFDVSDGGAAWDVMSGVTEELWRRGKPVPVGRLSHADAADLLGGSAAAEPRLGWAPRLDGEWWGDARAKT